MHCYRKFFNDKWEIEETIKMPHLRASLVDCWTAVMFYGFILTEKKHFHRIFMDYLTDVPLQCNGYEYNISRLSNRTVGSLRLRRRVHVEISVKLWRYVAIKLGMKIKFNSLYRILVSCDIHRPTTLTQLQATVMLVAKLLQFISRPCCLAPLTST